MRKAIVTGAAGFIGSALCRRLGRDGVAVVPLDISTGFDVCSEVAVADVIVKHKPDVVFHLAAIATTQQANSEPEKCYAVNVGSVKTFLDLAEKHKINRVVVPGTYLAPTEHYSRSKKEASDLCVGHQYKGARLITHCNVYGPNDNNSKRIIPQIITNALSGGIPTVALNTRRAFSYIDDIVDCYMEIAMGGVGSRSTKVAGTVIDLIDLAKLIMSKITYCDCYVNVVEGSKLKPFDDDFNDSCIQPKTSLDKGIEKTISWYRANL